ncbi:MAG: outer membrane beta-barrel protein [Aliarcobacter sp.]|nr:outer membrane beta-barrel protein [Aliarcobacter sp.]
MKKTLVMASLVAASTSMMAMDLQYFLGAGAERANSNFRATDVGIDNKIDIKDTSLKLSGGIIIDKTHRIYLSYSKFSDNNYDYKIEQNNILGNYDYLIPINEQFRLYTGLHLGNTKVDIQENALYKISFSGLAYGAQFGAIYEITKNIEFEAGLAYTKYNVDREADGSYFNIELEDSTSMFAGINYKF